MHYLLDVSTIYPLRLNDFIAKTGENAVPIREHYGGILEGMWRSEIGVLNQAVQLWKCPEEIDPHAFDRRVRSDAEWSENYMSKIETDIVAQDHSVLTMVEPLLRPAEASHFYELRTYTTRPGKVDEASQLLKSILPIRSKASPTMGIWINASVANQFCHIWPYHDLNTRQDVRGGMSGENWESFVPKMQALLVAQVSQILVPLAFSPAK